MAGKLCDIFERSVSLTLLLSMLAFGAFVGIVFPLLIDLAFGANQETVLTFRFGVLCVLAGLAVGAVNFLLFKALVSRQLGRVVEGMRNVNTGVAKALDGQDGDHQICRLEVNSADMIGEVAETFNKMSGAIAQRITLESSMRKLMLALSSSVNQGKVAHKILGALVDGCGAMGGVLYGARHEEMELLALHGIDETGKLPKKISPDQGLAVQAMARGEALVLPLPRDGVEWLTLSSPLGGFRPAALQLVPLIAESHAVGLIVLACQEARLSPERKKLLDAFSSSVGPYLQNAILHQKIEEMAAVDGLTNTLNRRFGLRRLQEEFSRAVRQAGEVSVIMVDVDYFKNVNDTFGHPAGDAVLKAVASVLEANVRAGEVVCRYGGEEFLIIAPGAGSRDAGMLAHRLCELIEATMVSWNNQTLSVTISLGVATWPGSPASVPGDLIQAADEALYFAKKAGRNRVAVHQEDGVALVAK